MRTTRIDQIEQYIIDEKSVSIDKLCDEFKVSKNTIRRDIDYLVKKESILKVYGGVKSNVVSNPLVSFEERTIKNEDFKDKIAKAAAELVTDNDTIFIDSGTTTLNMIDYLKNRNNLTVITNNLHVILKGLMCENINFISLPGTLKKQTASFVGNATAEFLDNYNVSKAFMACTAISIATGITNSDSQEYVVKKKIVEKSQSHYLLVDSTKFDNAALMTYAQISDMTAVITDKLPDNKYIEFFLSKSIKLLIAK